MNNIDDFYIEMNSHMKLISSHMEKKVYYFIIKACRLKPFDFLNNSYSKLTFINHWIDEYRNSLYLKNTTHKLVFNNLNTKKIDSTDLYGCLSLDKIVKISKSIIFFNGKEDLFGDDVYIFAFLGIDGYLRSIGFAYGRVYTIPPLMLGYKILEFIYKNQKIIDIKEKELECDAFPCIRGNVVIDCLPMGAKTIKKIKDCNPAFLELLGV